LSLSNVDCDFLGNEAETEWQIIRPAQNESCWTLWRLL